MYLSKPSDLYWACDVEGNNLYEDITQIWCVCVENILTRERRTLLTYEQIREFFESEIKRGAFFIFHNGFGFDVPSLNKLVGTRIPVSRVVDTFVLSMVYYPSLDGGHSLEAWGVRVKMPKGDFHDFSQRSDEMITYCIQDTAICAETYKRLVVQMLRMGFTELGCKIEHLMWNIIRTQRINGFKFDIKKAHILYSELKSIEKELENEIYKRWPPQLVEYKTFAKAFKKDGTHTKDYDRHREQYPRYILHRDGSYTVYHWVSFNLGSAPQRVAKLVELGWKHLPDEVTKTGNPKPTDKGKLVPSLEKFAEESGIEEVRLLAEWMNINSRASMINTWIEAYNDKTGCIHGNLWLANTLRYRHSNPNSANIPAVRFGKQDGKDVPIFGKMGLFTYEARDLWTTRDLERRRLVGVDAKGIQFRILAHYLNDEEFTGIVLGGDIHEYNRSKTGIGTRAQNKTFGYAALLGAGAAKTASIFGVGVRQGGIIKDTWIATVPGLKRLYSRLEGELSRSGRITLCDGTPVIVPSPHMVLAYLLQGDESRIMKKAWIEVMKQVKKEGLDVLKVGDIHDEGQFDIRAGHVDRFIEICVQTFQDTGRFFNYNLPIECDAKVGRTWAETH